MVKYLQEQLKGVGALVNSVEMACLDYQLMTFNRLIIDEAALLDYIDIAPLFTNKFSA